MKSQILVDMDGVLADVYEQFIKMEYEESGILLKREELGGRKEEDVFPRFHKHVQSPNFFRTAPLIENSVEGLKYLNDKYKILIVSSATEFPNSLIEKLQWLNEHYPFISWKQMIFCGQKDSIRGDIMIDDHPKNLLTFENRKILFSQPHNYEVHSSDFERISGWQEIMEIL